MWKLTIEDDEGKQTQLPLAHEEYGVGRAESNSIRLTDRNVSRNHLALKKNGQGWLVRDLQSYNGTYINGARVIGEQAMHSGDVIQLGDYRLELLDEVVAPGAPPPPPPAPSAHQRPNRLVVVVGPGPGTEHPLDKEHFTIGRSEDATISINHSSVSRVHAELFALGNGRFEIVDKASANGIRINGVELKRGILEAGDALELGDVRLRFIGQGKMFRADMTQILPAGFNVVPGAQALTARSTRNKLIGLGAAVLLVITIGIVALVRSTNGKQGTNDPARKHLVTDKSAKQVDEALKLLDEGKDVEAAHKKLIEIGEDDRPSDDPRFQKVEAAWADVRFQAVDKETDKAKQKALLKEIVGGSLDPAQKGRAAKQITDIEAHEPPPVPTAEAHPMGTFVPGPGSTSAAPTVVQNLPNSGPPNEDQIRRSLENKVWGGRGSIDEIRMLKAICSHAGDKACRNRANEMLKKKQESP
jgi:pSer/pThr/pTyr-binding forkhead associated (FHA) protein